MTTHGKVPHCFTLDKDVSDAIKAELSRNPPPGYRKLNTGVSALVNGILARELLGMDDRCQPMTDATTRQLVDQTIVQLRRGLSQLADEGNLADDDLELCAAVGKHPAR